MARVWTALTKTTRTIGWVALAIAAMLGVVTAVVFGAVHTGNLAAFYVTSHSMAPGIQAGDLILSTAKPASDVRVGEVITVPQESATGDSVAYVTHRVVNIEPGLSQQEPIITLQGDGNATPDPVPFTGQEVLAHQVTIPGGADLLHFLRTPPTPYFIVLLVIAGLGFTFLPAASSSGQGLSEEGQEDAGQEDRLPTPEPHPDHAEPEPEPEPVLEAVGPGLLGPITPPPPPPPRP